MKNFLLIQTGGTLTMVRTSVGGVLKPSTSISDIIEKIPELKRFGNIETLNLFNIDSTNMRPSNWLTIASVINNSIDKYDGIIIVHGTDTISYTASALSYMIQNPPIPIILTGSQLPMAHMASDAKNNLINSFRLLSMEIPEILVVFGSEIIRGVRTRKISVYDFEAMNSVNEIPIGKIGITIRLNKKIEKNRKKYRYAPHLCEEIFALKVFPGIRSGTILTLIDQGIKGIFVEGYGIGNVPTGEYSMIPEIKEASKRGIPIVIGTQCLFGKVDLLSYEVGKLALEVGAIPAYDMTPETSIVKLMWALGKYKNLDKIRKIMHTNIAGELEKKVWK